MHLRLTVVDPTSAAAPVDCAIEVAAGATLGEIRVPLLRAVDRRSGRLYCGTTALDDAAPVGLPPLTEGAVLTVDRPAPAGPRGLLELHVTAGPDGGAVYRLAPGEHGIGRAAEAAVRVDDPDVSRLHALVRVGTEGPGGTTIHDLDSTNGTTVDGHPVDRAGRPLLPGQVVQVGESRLQLVRPELVPAACRADGEGRLQLNRPPRLLPPATPVRVTLPAPPPRRDASRFPLVALAIPLLAGLVLVAVTRSPTYLLFAVLSPLMVLGSFVSDRVGGQRGARAEQRAYDEALAQVRAHLDGAVRAQTAARHLLHPGAPALMLAATGPRPHLWERRRDDADFLTLRVGLGDLPADVEGQRLGGGGVDEPPTLRAVPVTVSLREAGVVGVAGRRDRVLAAVRFWVAQLAGWHSPRHLGLAVLVAEDAAAPDWEWTRWLPHLRPSDGEDAELLVGVGPGQVHARVAELLTLLDARTEQAARGVAASGQGRCVAVVLDGAAALRRLPGIARLLDEGPAVGLFFLCVDRDAVALPAECGAAVEVTGEVATRLRVTVEGSAALDDVVIDSVSRHWAHRFARALAPLEDATPYDEQASLPARARLLDLLDLDPTDPAALATSWRVSPRGTQAVLGVGAGGEPLVVDLRADGPHALVAGTTGSGKSELLQTLVAGLAVANRPDEMCFVLIDYKGGAAFRDCARLPHTVGTVTDLDGHLTERALASLTAELRRRETVLRDAGCKDIDDFLAAATPGGGSLPRLVLVVDEFATLVEELPDFVGGLVGIAQRGRSLGVHLVLATQRPSGVVSADIRANTTLRIALRVTDPAESADVIDAKDAAAIGRRSPGRAVARVGAGPVLPFQAARVGGHAEKDQQPAARIRPLSWRRAGDPPLRHSASVADDRTDLARLVDAARAAAARLGVPPLPSPWLPPLGDLMTLDDAPRVPGRWSAPFGVRDLPAQQRRAPLTLDLEHGGHLLVAGGARSGRSTLLRTLAGSLAARVPATSLHLYALDGGGGATGCLAALPHCGAAVPRDQTARGDRLLSRLLAEVERRQTLLAGAGLASVAEQRAAAVPADRLPWIVLLVDGWEGVQSAYDEVDHGRPLDVLLRLVREGAGVGLRVVVTGDRGLLTSRVGTAISTRLLLRLADPADYALAGVPLRQVPAAGPPGRGLLADEGVEVQVALLDRDPSGPAQVAAMRRIASAAPVSGDVPGHQRPVRVEPLPARVDVDEIRAEAKAAATAPLWCLLGVGGDELAPAGVDLALDGPAFVVAGPPGSGRSTTLATMTRWLGHQGVATVLIAHRRSPLHALVGEAGVLACLGADDEAALAALLESGPGQVVVLADDAETLHDTAVERPLLALLRPHATRAAPVVLAGSSADMAGMFRGVTVEARRHRCGLLLGAGGPADGDLLGIRAARCPDSRPGRGLLTVRGRVQPVQVAVTGGCA